MKKMLALLFVLSLMSIAVTASGESPSAVPDKSGPEKSETGVKPAPVPGQNQPGIRYQDTNNNGICDNFEKGTPQGRQFRGGGRQGAASGAGAGQGCRYGQGKPAGAGAASGGRGGQRQHRRLRDGSCLAR